ncbi:MAG: N-formylglutamate deformylase [Polyangiaceae bacterium]|nr:N-formylglutamate deformylase [Polyangiaceae bacterium]
MSAVFSLVTGTAPLLVSFPHDGTEIPDDLEQRMTPEARRRPDTDWHVARLYELVGALGASVLTPRHSRYVVDLNRSPTGAVLYPGADNTGLVPTSTFAGDPIYLPGQEPSDDEVIARIEAYHQPYHQAIESELARLVGAHGVAIVFDAHSIRSEVPRFFEGRLPDLNLGTASGASADPGLAERLDRVLSDNRDGYSSVRDGRFKGGYITRHYGRPAQGVHAVQLELSQRTYMHEAPPFAFDEARANRLRPTLRRFVVALLAWAGEQRRA